MRKILFLAAFLPATLFAQDITNTLGASGTFIVEDNANNDIIRASRPSPGTTRIIFGDYSNSFNLPSGDIDFIHNNGSERVNIVVGKSGAFTAIPKLNFFYTPGSLTSPLTPVDAQTLGVIGFGGYTTGGGGWLEGQASIKAEVQGTPISGNIPTKLVFSTRTSIATVNTMTFDNAGNLTVKSAITSQAIKSVSGTYAATLNDQTLICTAATDIDLPAASALTGKVYTIKKGDAANFSITVDGNGGGNIDDNASILFGGNSTYDYIVIQSDGTQWYVIAQGVGL